MNRFKSFIVILFLITISTVSAATNCEKYVADELVSDLYEHVDLDFVYGKDAIKNCKTNLVSQKELFYWGKSLLANGDKEEAFSYFLKLAGDGYFPAKVYLNYYYDYMLENSCTGFKLVEYDKSTEYYDFLYNCFIFNKYNYNIHKIIEFLNYSEKYIHNLSEEEKYALKAFYYWGMYKGYDGESKKYLGEAKIHDLINLSGADKYLFHKIQLEKNNVFFAKKLLNSMSSLDGNYYYLSLYESIYYFYEIDEDFADFQMCKFVKIRKGNLDFFKRKLNCN